MWGRRSHQREEGKRRSCFSPTRPVARTVVLRDVARNVFVTGDEPVNAEQPGEADVIESLSEMLFGEDAEQDDGLYWERPR